MIVLDFFQERLPAFLVGALIRRAIRTPSVPATIAIAHEGVFCFEREWRLIRSNERGERSLG
jgi:hypothetical protein